MISFQKIYYGEDLNAFVNIVIYFNNYYSDFDFANFRNNLIKKQKNVLTIPKTKEELYYRIIFDKIFPNTDNIIPFFWRDLWKHV